MKSAVSLGAISSAENEQARHPCEMTVTFADEMWGRGSTERYWRAGYTRKDGTRVKGHYVNKSRS